MSPPTKIDLKFTLNSGWKKGALSPWKPADSGIAEYSAPSERQYNTPPLLLSMSLFSSLSLACVRACASAHLRVRLALSRYFGFHFPLLFLLLCEFFVCLLCFGVLSFLLLCAAEVFSFLFLGAVFCHNFSFLFCLFEEERQPTARNAKFGSFVFGFFLGSGEGFLFLVCLSLASFPVMG